MRLLLWFCCSWITVFGTMALWFWYPPQTWSHGILNVLTIACALKMTNLLEDEAERFCRLYGLFTLTKRDET